MDNTTHTGFFLIRDRTYLLRQDDREQQIQLDPSFKPWEAIKFKNCPVVCTFKNGLVTKIEKQQLVFGLQTNIETPDGIKFKEAPRIIPKKIDTARQKGLDSKSASKHTAELSSEHLENKDQSDFLNLKTGNIAPLQVSTDPTSITHWEEEKKPNTRRVLEERTTWELPQGTSQIEGIFQSKGRELSIICDEQNVKLSYSGQFFSANLDQIRRLDGKVACIVVNKKGQTVWLNSLNNTQQFVGPTATRQLTAKQSSCSPVDNFQLMTQKGMFGFFKAELKDTWFAFLKAEGQEYEQEYVYGDLVFQKKAQSSLIYKNSTQNLEYARMFLACLIRKGFRNHTAGTGIMVGARSFIFENSLFIRAFTKQYTYLSKPALMEGGTFYVEYAGRTYLAQHLDDKKTAFSETFSHKDFGELSVFEYFNKYKKKSIDKEEKLIKTVYDELLFPVKLCKYIKGIINQQTRCQNTAQILPEWLKELSKVLSLEIPAHASIKFCP